MNFDSNGNLEYNDLSNFQAKKFLKQHLKCMIVVGNDCNQYLLYKTEKANAKAFYNEYSQHMNNLLKSYQEEKISLEEALNLSENIYKEANKYGLEFRKI